MSDYVFGTSLQYQDYLQAKSFEDGIRGEISSASRSIIASNEELARDHIAVSSAISSGFEQLSFDVYALSDGVAELNSTFRWGFSEVLTLLGGVNDSLHELIKIAKTPEQTWAYEQFEIARDAFHQELYDDAIQYLNRAIGGHGDHTGYNLEYRFHYILGVIRIGSFKNHKEVFDLLQAEKAFLNAAKYAKRYHTKEAALSYLGAGRAAYCSGNMQAAEAHSREALALDTSLGEAHFQLAKIQMHSGNPEAALLPLMSAIKLDRGYIIKALTDDDFTGYTEHVDSLIEVLREDAMRTAQRRFDKIESDIVSLETSRAEQFPLAGYAPIGAVRKILDAAKGVANAGTYYGFLDALPLCESAKAAVASAYQTLRQMHQQQLHQIEVQRSQEQTGLEKRAAERTAARSERTRRKANIAMGLSLAGLLFFPVSIAGVVLGIIALDEIKHGYDQEDKGKAIAAIVIGCIVFLLYLRLIVAAISKGN